jgi:hypothetical protein
MTICLWFLFSVGVRCCAWATGDRMFLSVTENVMGHPAAIHIHRLADDLSSRTRSSDCFCSIK